MPFLFFDCTLGGNAENWLNNADNNNVGQRRIDLLESILNSDESELEAIDIHNVFYDHFSGLDNLISRWRINFVALRKYLIATTKYRECKVIHSTVDGRNFTEKIKTSRIWERIGAISVPFGDIIQNFGRDDIWGIKSIKIRLDGLGLNNESRFVMFNQPTITDHYEIKLAINIPIVKDIANPHSHEWNRCDIFDVELIKFANFIELSCNIEENIGLKMFNSFMHNLEEMKFELIIISQFNLAKFGTMSITLDCFTNRLNQPGAQENLNQDFSNKIANSEMKNMALVAFIRSQAELFGIKEPDPTER